MEYLFGVEFYVVVKLSGFTIMYLTSCSEMFSLQQRNKSLVFSDISLFKQHCLTSVDLTSRLEDRELTISNIY